MSHPDVDPLYYLDNFRVLLDWIHERYSDVLNAGEHLFIDRFATLPEGAQALLVRLIMRKGELFRRSRLSYQEIDALGGIEVAIHALEKTGLIDCAPKVSLGQLFGLFRRDELEAMFGAAPKGMKKPQWHDYLSAEYSKDSRLSEWSPTSDDVVIKLTNTLVYQYLRLMFFGNLRQDFSEFILADLGVYHFEKVAFDSSSRGFYSRVDIESYMSLHNAREALDDAVGHSALTELMNNQTVQQVLNTELQTPWIEQRRQRILLRYAETYAREGECEYSLFFYARCNASGARIKHLRLLERLHRWEAAYALAKAAEAAPESSEELQHLERIQPRIERHLGMPKRHRKPTQEVTSFTLSIPQCGNVEMTTAVYLSAVDAPVFYVENGLVNSLFGLLFWEAIFAPIQGAFFHPFHIGPVDLYRSDFIDKRQALFDKGLASIDDGSYIPIILDRYTSRQGIQSPFVHWGVIDEALLSLALHCIPPEHLRLWCLWLMEDIKRNRSGFADLVQFFPAQKRYRMIEVKGPGDRLQDNQRRMIAYCQQHDMPVEVCWVQWSDSSL